MEENKQEENIFDEILVQDRQAFNSFLNNIYGASVPPPEKPTKKDLSFFAMAGLDLILFFFSAIGAALLSAIRTGALFFLIEYLLVQDFNVGQPIAVAFGIIAMIGSLFGFEGNLLAIGLRKGRESGKLTVSGWSIFVSFATIIAAGIFSSFSIVNLSGSNAQEIMKVVMALITGAASGVVAYFSSENFGFILNSVSTRRNELLHNHQLAFKEWLDGANEAYKKSSYNIRSKRASQIYGNGLLQSNFTSEAGTSNLLQNTGNLEPKLKSSEIAGNFIEAFLNKNGRLPTQTEIVDGANVGSTSAYYYMCEYMDKNADKLIQYGIKRGDGSVITSDVIQKARESLSKKNSNSSLTENQ